MKTIQLKTMPLIMDEFPNGANNVHVNRENNSVIVWGIGEMVPFGAHPMPNELELIGKLSELPEEWFDKYIRSLPHPVSTKRVYRDYRKPYVIGHDTYTLDTARESFYSLLEAKEQVYLNGNPLPHPGNFKVANRRDYLEMKRKWQEAQSRTFDPERTYLFTVKTEK